MVRSHMSRNEPNNDNLLSNYTVPTCFISEHRLFVCFAFGVLNKPLCHSSSNEYDLFPWNCCCHSIRVLIIIIYSTAERLWATLSVCAIWYERRSYERRPFNVIATTAITGYSQFVYECEPFVWRVISVDVALRVDLCEMTRPETYIRHKYHSVVYIQLNSLRSIAKARRDEICFFLFVCIHYHWHKLRSSSTMTIVSAGNLRRCAPKILEFGMTTRNKYVQSSFTIPVAEATGTCELIVEWGVSECSQSF